MFLISYYSFNEESLTSMESFHLHKRFFIVENSSLDFLNDFYFKKGLF